MKKCVIYARCATKDQAENITNLETQVQELREYANKQGFEVVNIFQEYGSGVDLDRPVFNQLLKEVNENQIKSILCKSTDRISRDFAYQFYIKELFHKKGIEIITAQEETPETKFIENITALFASYEKTKLVRRLQLGKLRKSLGIK